MAKATKTKNNTKPVRDLTYWLSDLSFVPDSYKESKLWFAQMLFFAKLNGQVFCDPAKFARYQALKRLELDTQTYVNLIDPPTPMGGGGKAEYFASDWKANPIDIHLDNIVRAKLDKIGVINKLEVNEIDKYAKTQRQLDKDRIIFQQQFRQLINTVNKQLGLPPITESESPYEYIKRLNESKAGQQQANGKGNIADQLSQLIDYIRNEIRDSQDLSLYERYVYKGDIERAFELGIEHYLINQNKWRIRSEYFVEDLMNYNRACGRWYTDQTTGRGVVEYLRPDRLYTNPFYERDGEDITFWFYEKNITFQDFVRQFGTTLSDEQLKEVFLLNKYNGTSHGLEYATTQDRVRNNAMIKIGFMSVLSQCAETFAETYVNNRNPTWQKAPNDWTPDEESATQKQKIYNVWYSCYYIPPPGDRSQNTQANWQWQSQYIFDINKEIDMFRYGVDSRYAKSSLVIWKDDRPSFMDIKQAYMPKINTTWHKFQNCLVQDVTGMAIDEDFLGTILNAVDEGNKVDLSRPDQPTGGNGLDAGMQAWKMLRQGGMAWLKFRDKNGNIITGLDPSKFFVKVDTGHLDKAEKYLEIILQQYNIMVLALAQNDVTQGQVPKARTAVAGIEASIEASNNGIWFIEKPVREFTIMYGERCVQHILCMVKEKKKYNYEKRWREFEDVIGLANALMIEGIEDIPIEDIGITVSLEDTSAQQEYIFELANKMADNKEVGREAVGLVIDVAKFNYKYAYALLMLEAKKQERENANKEELAHQRQMELGQQQLQIAIQLKQADAQGRNSNIQTQGKVDAQLEQLITQLKLQSALTQKEQLKNNKIEVDNNKENLKATAENQAPFTPITQNVTQPS